MTGKARESRAEETDKDSLSEELRGEFTEVADALVCEVERLYGEFSAQERETFVYEIESLIRQGIILGAIGATEHKDIHAQAAVHLALIGVEKTKTIGDIVIHQIARTAVMHGIGLWTIWTSPPAEADPSST